MKRAIAILLVVLLLITTVWATTATIYPRAGFVRAIEYDADLIYIEDVAGLVWIYKGVEDLNCGDHVAMLMFNNISPRYIRDDVILAIR